VLPPGERLRTGIRRLGLDPSAETLERLEAFAALVRSANRAFNLVSRQDIPRLETRHILDSLALGAWLLGQQRLREGSTLLDVGSGGGFPGLVIGILCPGVIMQLVDRSERKVRHLSRCVQTLGLPNVETKCHDVAREPVPDRFDLITSRAVAPATSMWPWIRDSLRPGGWFVHMSFAAGETAQPPDVPGGVSRMEVLQIPELDARHVVAVIENSTTG
jgi:16S rRNA (guanine527-N7)-methyltransferase